MGRPLLYGTTDHFLEYFGLPSLDALPRPDELEILFADRERQQELPLEEVTRVRLQRFLAQAGVASRRKSEDLIAAGLVQVNGRSGHRHRHVGRSGGGRGPSQGSQDHGELRRFRAGGRDRRRAEQAGGVSDRSIGRARSSHGVRPRAGAAGRAPDLRRSPGHRYGGIAAPDDTRTACPSPDPPPLGGGARVPCRDAGPARRAPPDGSGPARNRPRGRANSSVPRASSSAGVNGARWNSFCTRGGSARCGGSSRRAGPGGAARPDTLRVPDAGGLAPGRSRRLAREELTRLLALVDPPAAPASPRKRGHGSWT